MSRGCKKLLLAAFIGMLGAGMASAVAAAEQAVAPAATPAADSGPSDVTSMVAKAVAQLKLNPQQEAAFLAFEALMVDRTQPPPADPDAYRSMSLPQKFDYIEERTALAESRTRAADQAAHRLYDLLSPDQQKGLDQLMYPQKSSLAPGETPLPAALGPNGAQTGRTEPDWLVKPSADEIARLYPRDAQRHHIAGATVLHCTADTDGYLSDCTVTKEEPKNAGFGNAALQISSYMRMKPGTVNGVPVESAVNVPVDFNF